VAPLLPHTLPPLDPLRLVVRIHGHLGWLAAIALVHPAILLRRTKRKADLSVGLSVGLVTTVFGIGVSMYTDYRDHLRQALFQHGPGYGYLFERKEHLAFGVLLLAWAGALSYAGARWVDGGPQAALRKAAHWAFVAAAVMAVVTAGLGTVVAAFRSF
jgi:hypothetical protein